MLAQNYAFTDETSLEISIDQKRTAQPDREHTLSLELSNAHFVDFHDHGHEIENVVVLSVN